MEDLLPKIAILVGVVVGTIGLFFAVKGYDELEVLEDEGLGDQPVVPDELRTR